jgi:hypothetical protein
MTTFTTPASINGVAQEGELLTALGEVDDPTATITYQWQENINGTWTDIPGATNPTYTVIEADEGNALRVVETATDGGTAMSTSDPTAAVTDITLAFTSAASIDNTAPREGDTLSAVNGSLNDADASVTSYQWQRSINGTWTDIPGATSQTYTVVRDDGANQLRVVETATDTDGGPLVTSTSDPTAAVLNPPPPAGTSVFLFTGKQNPDSSTTFSIYDLGNNSVLAGPYVLGDAPPQVKVEATSYLNGSTLAAMFRIEDGSGTLAYTPIVDRAVLPAQPAYLEPGYSPTPFNGTYPPRGQTLGITFKEIPPSASNPIAYGRLWYRDVYGEYHFSFILPILTPHDHTDLVGISEAYTSST